MREKLTAKTVENAKKPGRYNDGGNLVLQVGKTGNKSWAFIYMRDGRSHQLGLGSAQDRTLKEARVKAAEYRKLLLDGGDPLEHRRVLRRATGETFKQCAERCVEAHKAGWNNDKSEAQWRSSLEAYVYPHFGPSPVQAVTTADVLAVLQPIWTSKPETANRVRKRIERVLDYASALKLRQGENPARWRGNLDHLLPTQAKVRRVKHHAALPYADLSAFMAELKPQNGTAAQALEFAILTAARTGEVLGASWSELDLDEGVWTIPAERMKAQREHRVPLSASAVSLLKALPRDTKSNLVFVGSQPGKPLSNMAMLALLKRMKRKDLTTHGFRSTFRDWAAETTGYPGDVVEMALAHTVGNKVEAAYRRGDLFDKRRRLMDDWATYAASPGRSSASVVSMREAAHA